jgi:hypothetical protein
MGYYVDKSMNVNKNSIEDLTSEQLEERMKAIITDYENILVGDKIKED